MFIVMDSKKITFIMVFTLLIIFRLIEGKGLCQFAEMFPTKGSNESIQQGTTKDNVTPETNDSTLPSTTLPPTPSPLEWYTNSAPPSLGYETTQYRALTTMECPPNMVHGNCSCQLSCDDPTGTRITSCECLELETCLCADGFLKRGDSCVSPSACGCYISEVDLVIPNNETYINATCDEKCICQDDQLICNSDYECSPYGVCSVLEGVRQCYCKDGYQGDGETCVPYKDCYDIFQAGYTQDGVYMIQPAGWPWSPFEVFCDMTTSEGGWTVFQRRLDGVTDFNRSWASYQRGFGSVHNGSDFWLGNDQLYYLTITNQRIYKLRVDIVNPGGSPKYEEYASFRITGADVKYRLFDLGSHSGNAGNGMSNAMGRNFSTYDQDNDDCDLHNCAGKHGGGWWHTNFWCSDCSNTTCNQFRYNSVCTTQCTTSNLNGNYNGGDGEGLFWRQDQHCNLPSVEMKIRPFL